jgi:tryptophan halogenase
MEHVRDFVILHYHATQRDEPMWRECREMELPATLALRLAAWRERAHAWQGADELFRLDSWTHVLLGQGIEPSQHHPLPRAMPDAALQRLLASIRDPVENAVAGMPAQHAFIERYCKAGPGVWDAGRPSQPPVKDRA